MTLVLNAEDVERAADMRSLIASIEKGLREEASGQVVMPPRLNMSTSAGTFRIMPAVMNASGLMGYKAFQGSRKSGVRYLVALYEQEQGGLLALMDASYLTAVRTGAVTGIATKFLARPNADVVAVIGSGMQARANLEAVCAVRSVSTARVFSTNRDRREGFARNVGYQLGLEIAPAESPSACVDGAEIVIVATNTSKASDPIAYRGSWMGPGVHVNSIGSTVPWLREIDEETFAGADRVIVDSAVQVEEESGDVISAVEQGAYDRSKVVELKDVVGGLATGRERTEDTTVYKSVGTAVQDVMAGYAVYEEARRQSVGYELEDFLARRVF